jgi:hypothetical protein
LKKEKKKSKKERKRKPLKRQRQQHNTRCFNQFVKKNEEDALENCISLSEPTATNHHLEACHEF